jgi:hypothetical protein
VDGLRQYARQTLQQYANGATLGGIRAQQQAVAETAAAAVGPAQSSPNMVYMQNLTAIVLLTIESLQQKGLAHGRRELLQRLRERLGMAAAPAPEDDVRCASSILTALPSVAV